MGWESNWELVRLADKLLKSPIWRAQKSSLDLIYLCEQRDQQTCPYEYKSEMRVLISVHMSLYRHRVRGIVGRSIIEGGGWGGALFALPIELQERMRGACQYSV